MRLFLSNVRELILSVNDKNDIENISTFMANEGLLNTNKLIDLLNKTRTARSTSLTTEHNFQHLINTLKARYNLLSFHLDIINLIIELFDEKLGKIELNALNEISMKKDNLTKIYQTVIINWRSK